MFIPKFVVAASLLLLGGLTLTGVANSARQPSDPPAGTKGGSVDARQPPAGGGGARVVEVRELQKERLSLLRQIVADLDKQFQEGNAPLGQVLEAQRDVTAAELELCETIKERITVLEKRVELAKQIERTIGAAVRAGEAPKASELRAKVNRLDAEIELARADSAHKN